MTGPDTHPEPDYDVVVVGGGPTGLIAAALLGRRHRVLAVERHPRPYGLPRAGHLDFETMRVLQGLGAHRPLLADSVTAPYRWFGAQGDTLLSFDPALTPSGFYSDYMFYQPVMEDALRDVLAAESDRVDVLMGATVTGVDQDGAGATVVVEPAGGGDPRRVRARWVVAADGCASRVRTLLSITQTDLGFAEDWLDVDVRIRRPLRADIDGQHCDPARPAYIGSLGKRHHRFEFALLPGESWERMQDPAVAWELLGARGVTSDDVEILRQVVYRFEAKVADRWRVGRVLLAGDAAHTMPPHFGQGMCSGVRDAANLAWKLDLVLRGRASEALLDTYEAERASHARTWVQMSVGLGQVSCTLDAAKAAERDAALLAGHLPPIVAPTLIGGILQAGAPAGELSPQDEVCLDGRTGPAHELVDDGFLLVTSDDGTLDAQARATAERFGVTVVPLAAVTGGGGYAALLAAHGSTALLVRPDHYVFGVDRSGAGAAGLLAELAAAVDGVAPTAVPAGLTASGVAG